MIRFNAATNILTCSKNFDMSDLKSIVLEYFESDDNYDNFLNFIKSNYKNDFDYFYNESKNKDYMSNASTEELDAAALTDATLFLLVDKGLDYKDLEYFILQTT